MKLRSPLLCASLAGISLAVLAGTTVAGCSDDDETTGPGTSTTSKAPPARPTDGAAGDGPGYVFAVNRLFLGDTDRNGSPSSTAWEDYGYDLDGKVSTKDSTDLCQPAPGAIPAQVRPDGKNGVDNSFGKQLVPLLTSLVGDLSGTANSNIDEGDFTVMVRIDSLGSQPSYVDLPSALYIGSSLGAPPKFDGSDEWPVIPELLSNPADIDTSLVKFPGSYVNEQTWVSGSPANLDLQLSIAGFSLTLEITNAIITMDLDPARDGVTNGIIAGVIPVEGFIAELKKVVGAFSPDFCASTTFENVAERIRQAADILADGTQDPNVQCDAISIGIGFDAAPVKLGGIADAAEPAEDPCAEGTGGGGGSDQGSGGAGGGNG